jgi:hypothetical protein
LGRGYVHHGVIGCREHLKIREQDEPVDAFARLA